MDGMRTYLVLEERVVFTVKRGRELQRRGLTPSISEGKHGPVDVTSREGAKTQS